MSIREDEVRRLPCWSGAVTIEALGGGITNTNFTVSCAGREYVVRLGSDIPEHNVVRTIELAAAKAAHAAGIAPAIVHWQPGALVMNKIAGETLNPEQVREPGRLARIVGVLKTCHRCIPEHFRGPAPMFWAFQVLRDYSACLREMKSPWSNELGRLNRCARDLEAAVGSIDLVFGHNDLLAANLIDDGRQIWLIDWEYAGFNSALFDLSGLASNNEFDSDLEREMLVQYFGVPPDSALLRGYSAMKCASLLRETMWSMVSELCSSIDFDYAEYTRENIERFDTAWRHFSGGTR